MKFLYKLINIFILIISIFFININYTSAITSSISTNNLNNNISSVLKSGNDERNEILNNFKQGDSNFFDSTEGGTKGFYKLLYRIAKDLKNLFFALASIYFLILVIRLIYSGDSEEGFNKFKKGILWISLGIIIMQIAYLFVKTLYFGEMQGYDASMLVKNIFYPLVNILSVLASIVFIFMAIRAFYFLITSNGNEESTKKGKMTIVYAIIGFILIKFTKTIVESVYGKINCYPYQNTSCINLSNLSWLAKKFLNIINWSNTFIALIVIIMIVYNGFKILTSGEDEEKLKEAKKSIIYITIGILIIISNYIIIKFFFFNYI